MLLSSDKLVIMKIVTCALVTIFIITRLSDDNITLQCEFFFLSGEMERCVTVSFIGVVG